MTVRLFVDAPLASDAEFELPAAVARHVQVRRLQPGDAVLLFNGQGGEWAACILRMGRSAVTVRVGVFDPVQRELGVRVDVALGVPANERMDMLVEKATELGVASIQPLQCERSVLRLAGERALRKREHWQAVAAAAAEQCGRTRVPEVAPVLRLDAWLGALDTDALRVLLSPAKAAAPLATLLRNARHVLTLSGPEGGLAPKEEAAAAARGFVAARLGDRVLRAETAPLAVLAWIGLNP